ncbi:MAG TPA: hypothetical protein VG867_05785 [Rhizomicrobium sp.]|nr:hypothetical protein [Rhizomicrobium sp.]
MKRSSRLLCASLLGPAAALLFVTASLGYGGSLGRDEKDANGNWTDFKNPLPTPDPEHPDQVLPHHYHVTVCNNGSWYGYWVPPEWQGVDGGVTHSDETPGQHGYAKGSDGTEGGLQVMGNGRGGDSVDVTLRKGGGNEITLTIRVIPCDSNHHYSRNNPHGIANLAPVAPSNNNRNGGVHINIGIGLGLGGGHDTHHDDHRRPSDKYYEPHGSDKQHQSGSNMHDGNGEHDSHGNGDTPPPKTDAPPEQQGPHD